MVLKLYAVSDGPSSLSVRQALKVLDIPFDLTNVDYGAGEHMTPEYAMMNPQKEIPVLEDDGFYLGESNAILQYLCDKYRPQSELLYPQEPRARAIVNHRLCFNLSTYYANISAYTIYEWYSNFKKDNPDLWKISEDAMKEIKHFIANPPDLTHLNHPIHPARKIKKKK
ncbi:unnamed protein product [Leptidea sinapis]|uniref:GST N-terminal domain-containing protein n=1 Tax=Leptidea sinapis TaxID=189913 RepID=A0A5E4PXE1_9NEOP|nr:unnamed protein product [Leptidea sinapis]